MGKGDTSTVHPPFSSRPNTNHVTLPSRCFINSSLAQPCCTPPLFFPSLFSFFLFFLSPFSKGLYIPSLHPALNMQHARHRKHTYTRATCNAHEASEIATSDTRYTRSWNIVLRSPTKKELIAFHIFSLPFSSSSIHVSSPAPPIFPNSLLFLLFPPSPLSLSFFLCGQFRGFSPRVLFFFSSSLQGNEREILWFLNKPINGEDGSEWIWRIGVRLTFLHADTERDGIGLSSVSSRLDTAVARKLYSKITWVFSCCSWSRFPRPGWLERRRLQCLLGKRWCFLLDGDSLIGIFQLLGGG